MNCSNHHTMVIATIHVITINRFYCTNILTALWLRNVNQPYRWVHKLVQQLICVVLVKVEAININRQNWIICIFTKTTPATTPTTTPATTTPTPTTTTIATTTTATTPLYILPTKSWTQYLHIFQPWNPLTQSNQKFLHLFSPQFAQVPCILHFYSSPSVIFASYTNISLFK